ncbi:XRE family transcriptional regulator [Streptomyces anulatus]|uniref:telomere-protecting terminal protein Tpg n=1 Tax=Streptomyces anulatus TaxID=1892 RepID=UPI001C5E5FBD|nr:XRE family transcriptional regulator [Streptomyces anulatus]QYA98919.1 XRE family transcriptional regulator [Streptomyces anulatus]
MLDDFYTASIAEALDFADTHHWTRQPPRSDSARLRFLATRYADLGALASRLGAKPRLVKEVMKGWRSAPGSVLSHAIARDVVRLWQPRVRRRAHHLISTGRDGMLVHFKAWFGFTGAAGSSDDGRVRHITERLPTAYAARLFQARYRNADEGELREIIADAVGEAYFNVSPSGKLHMVALTDIVYIEFSY